MNFLGLFNAAYDKRFVLDELRQAMARHGTYAHWDVDRKSPPPKDELTRRVAAADVVLTGWGTPTLPEEILSVPGRKLRYVCHIAGQVSPFMSRKFLEQGLLVTNWGTEGVWTFAEGAVALLFGCLKEMHRIGAFMRQGDAWDFPFANPSPTLRDKTVGLVGFGAIARTVVQMLQPFRCRFLVFDPYLPAGASEADIQRCDRLEDLFSRAEIVSLHCGLTAQTRGLVGRPLLDLLRQHAIFINTSRGAVVRESELIEFLRARPDVIAGLDVYEAEPLPADSPLRGMDNVICYGHCVGLGGETFDRMICHVAAKNIEAFAAGRPMDGVITPDQYDRMS